MRYALLLVLLAACATAQDQREARSGDRYALTLQEQFPEKGREWHGTFTLGPPDAARPGSYTMTEVALVVGNCPRAADCTYQIEKVAAVFDPKLSQIYAADRSQPHAIFVAEDGQGNNLGNVMFSGNEWGSFNKLEAPVQSPFNPARMMRAAHNGTISAKRIGAP